MIITVQKETPSIGGVKTSEVLLTIKASPDLEGAIVAAIVTAMAAVDNPVYNPWIETSIHMDNFATPEDRQLISDATAKALND